jgi:hypothetical protein
MVASIVARLSVKYSTPSNEVVTVSATVCVVRVKDILRKISAYRYDSAL